MSGRVYYRPRACLSDLDHVEIIRQPWSKKLYSVPVKMTVTEATNHTKDVNGEVTATEDDTVEVKSPIIYKIGDSPPIYLTIFFAIQQSLIPISGSIVLPILVAKAVCALENGEVIRKLVSSTFFLSGLTTVLQTLIGVRLPVYQGPTSTYIVPIIALNEMDPSRCDISQLSAINAIQSANVSDAEMMEQLIDMRIRELMWPLVIAGLAHCLVGVTGLVGIFLKFVGPITIVPTILLIGLYLVRPATIFLESHWGVSAITWLVGVILTLYLGRRQMSIPVWSRKKGFHFIQYPLHQVFALLLSIIIGWSVCGIMTYTGALPDDKTNVMYKSRTDSRADIVRETGWFYMPHPGQFGSPLFSGNAIAGFLMASLISILDSINDYYVAAAICRVPPPPRHAVNRGIAVEGFCSALSGLFGVGHATTGYGINTGAIGMTKVASRHVFVATGVIYILFGVISKVSAIVVSMPYPVIGAVMLLSISVVIGVNLSNLRVVDLASTRNLTIMGMATFIGFLVPAWVQKNATAIDTGNDICDQIIIVFLGNPFFIGAFLGCFLDNTVPGTPEERGITAWQNPEVCAEAYVEGEEVYDFPMPECVKRRACMKYIPVCPSYSSSRREEYEIKHIGQNKV